MNEITPKYIENLSYTDFVGLINQWNVLPGSYSTLSKWVSFSHLDKTSKILEIACTTGFSSRELALMSGCSGDAFDLSQKSIESAKDNKEKYAPEVGINYFQQDGYIFNPDKKYTHVVMGASLGFFSDPPKMMERCLSFIEDGGYILASPFYIVDEIPQHLVDKAKKVFNFSITTSKYKDIMSLYNKLEILFEERNVLVQETEKEIKYYSQCTTDRACKMLNIKNQSAKESIFTRLCEIKYMSNKLRPYQEYTVLVLRYRSNLYPNRFVELF